MTRYITAVLAAAWLLALAAPSQAQQEHAQKLKGTWLRRSDGCKVRLEVKAESLRCTVTTEEGMAITVDADYVVSKDGILLGILRTPLDGKATDDDAVTKRLFYLQFTAEDRSLVVKDLEYKDSHDGDKMKELLEGKYHKIEGAHKSQTSHANKRSGTKTQTSQTPADPGKARCPSDVTSSDPNRPNSELLGAAGPRQTEYEWVRIWSIDEPSHFTAERIDGAVELCCSTDWHSVWKYFTAPVSPGFSWWVGW